MVVMTDSACLDGIFERLYERAKAAGYRLPPCYTDSGVITGLKEAIAYRHPNSRHPANLRGKEMDGHVVLETITQAGWKEISRVRIPQSK